jgi:acetyl-CoA carboxylase carboxyltransferase component
VNYQLQVANAALAAGNLAGGALALADQAAPVRVFYAPQEAAIGVLESEGAVIIKNLTAARQPK